MSLRDELISQNPDFPWLAAEDTAGVQGLLLKLGWLRDGEEIEQAARAGDGNMNLTLRVETNERCFVLKQARPWVEKFPEIAAPLERSRVEASFYKCVRDVAAVANRMPALLASDETSHLLMLEWLDGAQDLTALYAERPGGRLEEAVLLALANYLKALHGIPADPGRPALLNRAMRALNHEHIYIVPLEIENGVELDQLEPGLGATASALRGDGPFCRAAHELGRRYLEDGPQLLHGDFFPGSWLQTASGIRIIDPEFAFYGEPEFDLGYAIAHLALAWQPAASASSLLEHYANEKTISMETTAGFAAMEVVRRLLGIAQLPIPATTGWRRSLIEKARTAMLNRNWKHLFP